MKVLKYVLVALLISLSACAADRSEVHVNQAVRRFHAQYNDGRYGEIYDGAHDKLHDTVTKEEFIENLRKMNAKWGKVQHSKSLTAWTQWLPIPNTPRGRVHTILDSTFDNGRINEILDWECGSDRARLANYTAGKIVSRYSK